ncbi:MAG TPA: hypothetical protein VIJ33_04825 [Solirubrobacteraceae bacterium]
MKQSLRRARVTVGRVHALCLLACGLSALVVAGGASVAQAATACPSGANTWTGGAGDGYWGTPGNWSQGNAPGTSSSTEDVCLPDGATPYTVTLFPFVYNNSINNPPIAKIVANSLTVGNDATLVISGRSSNGNYSSSGGDVVSMALANGGSISPGGTLELQATDLNNGAGASDNGGHALITGATLTNAGTITSVSQTTQGADISHQNEFGISLDNAHGATFAVTGGTLNVTDGQTVTNDGTITIAPGAQIQEYANQFNTGPEMFTNAADGTIVPQIASASSFGTLEIGGDSTVNLGGTLAPSLVGDYTPAAGTALAVFPIGTNPTGGTPTINGTFATVSGGFTADYSHETTSPSYIGFVYGQAITGGGGPPSPTPKPSTLAYGKASVEGSTVRVTLSCSSGDGCPKATIRETVRVRVKGGRILGIAPAKAKSTKKIKIKVLVLGTHSVSLGSGKRTTVTLTLNATGRGLLARFHHLRLSVTAATGGKVKRTFSVTLTQPKKPKRRNHS